MPRFCVNSNAQSNGDNEVHKQGCNWWPSPDNCVDLGDHPTCREAVAKAKLTYQNADGCAYCCPECHTS